MSTTVTRVIWIKGNILEIKRSQASTPKWEVLDIVKRIPKGTHYIVKYTIDRLGLFLVAKRRIMVVINTKTEEDMGACFLPKSWDGKRVRRVVIVPIYEKDNKL